MANLPTEVAEWVNENQPIQLRSQLVTVAKTAVAHVKKQSELRDLWAETDELENWLNVVSDLQARLEKLQTS